MTAKNGWQESTKTVSSAHILRLDAAPIVTTTYKFAPKLSDMNSPVSVSAPEVSVKGSDLVVCANPVRCRVHVLVTGNLQREVVTSS